LEANQVQREKEAAEYLSKIQQELQQVKARQDEVTDELQKANEHNEHVQQQLLESKKRHIEELQQANEHSKNVQHQLSESKRLHIEELQKANENAGNVQHQLLESREHYNQLRSKYNVLLKERDTALKEVEKLRRRKSTAMPCQFSSSELERATENFSASLKIREDGFVSVYRGVLRNVKVEIKVLTSEGRLQFAHEVVYRTHFEVCFSYVMLGKGGDVLLLFSSKVELE
jgi:seryl-tRNA synthetase